MTERGNEFTGFAPERSETGDRSERLRSRAARVLFAVGLIVVAANSALYFFDVELLSHPAVSVLGLALLVPLYLRRR
ncbi:hypothetical protein M0R88_02380 [Halorussus gelatinilyticus]|uniref:Uncharacterized protein n=1 Tax=Halorussus gelatinilyticus TaxID=2937524 RepID=A0A8U0IIN0_9EURY|nr:hypothetical protein [Halorussus gelatinilyticus]UPW00957.1 hypothetical protein M0R88_02380 [Halorussus gelatinilyticus]